MKGSNFSNETEAVKEPEEKVVGLTVDIWGEAQQSWRKNSKVIDPKVAQMFWVLHPDGSWLLWRLLSCPELCSASVLDFMTHIFINHIIFWQLLESISALTPTQLLFHFPGCPMWCPNRKLHICHFISTSDPRLSHEELKNMQLWSHLSTCLLITRYDEMKWNVASIAPLMLSHCTNSFIYWMNNWDVVGSVAVQRKKCWEAIREKKISCLMSCNKQYALKVLGCQQVSNTGRLVFFSGKISGTVIQQERPGCIEADSLSGSYFQIHFHDKHLFQIHHGLSPLSESHAISGKTTSAAHCIDTWQWALILLHGNKTANKKPISHLCGQSWWETQTCAGGIRGRATGNAKKVQKLANVASSMGGMIKHGPSMTWSGFRLPCIT